MDARTRADVDAQFDRAVAIVQGLPKTGPIQTGYEAKLAMYSLYKQATVGNVVGVRPGLWDMLGRAKWDAWAKHKDLQPHAAKAAYIDALLKTLRKYPAQTAARDLVREIEAYGPVRGRGRSASRSSASGSSEDGQPAPRQGSLSSGALFEHDFDGASASGSASGSASDDAASDVEDAAHASALRADLVEALDTFDDRLPPLPPSVISQGSRPRSRAGFSASAGSQAGVRPGSAAASSRYRTPAPFPPVQPLPLVAAPSAFSGSPPPSARGGSRARAPSPPLGALAPHDSVSAYGGLGRTYSAPAPTLAPAHSTAALASALQAAQAHIAALVERLDVVEHALGALSAGGRPGLYRAGSSGSGLLSPPWLTPTRERRADDDAPGPWTPAELGLWAAPARVLAAVMRLLAYAAQFVVRPPARAGPLAMVLRRLALDASFLLVIAWAVRRAWRRGGARQRDVRIALGALARAVLGKGPPARLSRALAQGRGPTG